MNEQALLERLEPHEVQVITADPQVTEARLSPCGSYLAAGGFDGRLRLWHLGEEPEELPAITGHNGWVHAVVFHPDGDLIYSADSWGQIRATRFGRESHELVWQQTDAHDGWIRQLDLSPDRATLASCAPDGRVCIWSAADGELVREVTGHNDDVQSVRFHPSGKFLVSGDAKGLVKQWDVETGECVKEFDAASLHLLHRLQDVGGVRLLRFHPNGSQLAAGGVTPKNGGTVQGIPTLLVFDFASGERVASLEFGAANDCFLHDVHWHHEDVLIAVTSGTPGAGKVVFRRVQDDKPLFETTKLANCHSVSVHPDLRRMAVVATNRGSNGNGRRLTPDGEYAGNQSPIHLFRLGKEESA